MSRGHNVDSANASLKAAVTGEASYSSFVLSSFIQHLGIRPSSFPPAPIENLPRRGILGVSRFVPTHARGAVSLCSAKSKAPSRFPNWKRRSSGSGTSGRSTRSRWPPAEAPPFVFYEGPPTANGLPHPGHCLTRAIKDLFPRYRTMRGYRCERKAGWDTHGLPVEVEVCKELGIHSKEEIEAYGVEPFIHKCLESVFRYTKQWEQLTERLGFWIHLDEAYVTYHQSYVESVWWALKNLFDRGLLYQGHKIVWWWAQGGTALSAARSARAIARWPTRACMCVSRWSDADRAGLRRRRPAGLDHDALDAAEQPVRGRASPTWNTRRGRRRGRAAQADPGRRRWSRRSPRKAEQGVRRSRRRCRGEQLIGLPLSCRRSTTTTRRKATRPGPAAATAASSTSPGASCRPTSSPSTRGTGVVHQAPAFGEVDFDVLQAEQARFVDGEGPPLICSRRPRRQVHRRSARLPGPLGQGRRPRHHPQLEGRGLLFHQEQYLHDYPFCWRAEEDPLIQYPRKSWFIRTTAVQGRRCWPTTARSTGCPSTSATAASATSWRRTSIGPCRASATGARRCRSGSARRPATWRRSPATPSCWPSRACTGTEVWDKAKQANPELPDDLKVHKPYIDAVTYDSPFAAGRADAPRARGDRLLVRLRRDAVRPVGLSAPAGLGRAVRRPVPRRLHQRGARPDPRLVLQPAGDQHAAVRRDERRARRGQPATRSPPTAHRLSRIRSATASCSA